MHLSLNSGITLPAGMAGVTTMKPPPPSDFIIRGTGDRVLLRIVGATGEVEGDVADASEAGAVFVETIRRLFDGFRGAATAGQLVEYLERYDWRGDDVENPFGLTCRHADHDYNGGCAVCRADLPAMVGVLLGYWPAEDATQPDRP